MKLHIFAQQVTLPVCDDAPFTAALQALHAAGASQAVIYELNLMHDAEIGIFMSSAKIDGFCLEQDGSSYSVARVVERAPARQIEVGSAKEAVALLESERNDGVRANWRVMMNEGGARTRLADGKIIRAGKLNPFSEERIARSTKVEFLLCDAHGAALAAVL